MDRSRPSSPTMISIDIGNDIIVEILSWLPVDSLLRFKSVCKSWFNLIINPSFAKLLIHHHHSLITTQILNPSIMFISDKYYYSIKSMDKLIVSSSSSSSSSYVMDKPMMVNSFKCSQRFVTIVGSCNGLICLHAYDIGIDRRTCENNILCLWNPTIKEFESLPSHEDGDSTTNGAFQYRAFQYRKIWCYGICYDHVIDDYKVIASAQLWDVNCVRHSEVKVFTLGKKSWRRIQVEPPYKFELEYITISEILRTWTYVNGAFHRIARLSASEHRILSFDIVDEVYREVPNHPECFDTRYAWELTVLRGCLCLSAYACGTRDRYMELWMMKDYGVKESWTKLFSLTNVVRCYRLKPVWFCKNGEVVMEAGNLGEVVMYDPKQADEVKWSKSRFIDNLILKTTIYIGSLVSLKSQE